MKGIYQMKTLSIGLRTVGAAAVAASALAVAGTGVASASSAAAPVLCTHLNGTAKTDKATLKGCTATATGGTGTITHFYPTGGSVAWANGTSTVYSGHPVAVGARKCANDAMEINIKGKVTSSTNSAIPQGAPVWMAVCLNPFTGGITSAKGTVVTF